ncbi:MULTISPECIES: hypothetical protein [unclassified Vibrio]|uniref:hypothetical protein n=1 Tax=unclassified Vibrio TaxID=2614977 RepID=UPI001483A04D|nr:MULTISPECIES: hypothetical protein [unclassified Vibrio]NNN45339.1 hypothetical protein [Vibrio sp. 1-1(7)]NNN73377.1 hypothetical protein [Vibrio sp. 12-2(3-a)]
MKYRATLIVLGLLMLVGWQWPHHTLQADPLALSRMNQTKHTKLASESWKRLPNRDRSHSTNHPHQDVDSTLNKTNQRLQTINQDSLATNEEWPLSTLYAAPDTGAPQRPPHFKTQAKTNHPPYVDPRYYQQLQQELASWILQEGTMVNYSIAVDGLFIDPEGDSLSYRVEFNSQALKLFFSNQLTISGSPDRQENPLMLTIFATDNRDELDSEEHRWVAAHFQLSDVKPLPAISEQLLNQPLYRIHTTRVIAGQRYPFYVLQCEIFELKQGHVWYAASSDRQRCPQLNEMNIVATYQQQDEQIHLHFPSDKTANWRFRYRYSSNYYPGMQLYQVTSNENGPEETYSLFDQRIGAEARLNVHTGQYHYQGLNFDYLMLNEQQQYYPIGLFNYIYNLRNAQPNYYQPADSDLNVFHPTKSLFCRDVEPYWAYASLIGPTHYNVPLISESGDRAGNYPPLCGEYLRSQTRTALYFDHEFTAQDIPLDGKIYTYILYPRPEYAHLLEKFAINLIYHAPID